MLKLNFYAKCLVLASLHLGILACSSLPAFGPSSDDIAAAAQLEFNKNAKVAKFHLINITSDSLPAEQVPSFDRFPDSFIEQRFLEYNERIVTGDLLAIRIWEAAADGLFAANGQRETTFTLTVSNSGAIDVPYAGHITVAGNSVHQVREILLERYKGQAIDPEINVQIEETQSRAVAVLGAVREPGRAIVPSNGIRLLDLIALAGGTPDPPWETEVKVTRGNDAANLGLTRILDDSANNIVILPGDTIQVKHLPRQFAIYGAVNRPGNVVLATAQPTLSGLLAESGGLNYIRAEPNSVFVFRQREDAAEALPVAYRFDFARPDAFLLADKFVMKPSDVAYVATADASEFNKFMTILLSPFFGAAGNIQNLGN